MVIFERVQKLDFISIESQLRQRQQMMDENLIDRQAADDLAVTDKIYCSAYRYFRLCNGILLFYSLVRTLSLPFFIYESSPNSLTACLIALFIVSGLQFGCALFLSHLALIPDLYYAIANQTGHLQLRPANQFPPEFALEKFRFVDEFNFQGDNQFGEQQHEMKNLSKQIKFQLQHSRTWFGWFCYVQFILFQSAHIWGICLLIGHDFESSMTHKFLLIITIISTYQYIEFYLLMGIMILFIPFFILRRLYFYCRQKYHVHRMNNLLKSQAFTDDIKGDKECPICLQPYELGDALVVMPCSELHHFHAGCIREWSKNNNTCPVCRHNLSDF